MDLSVSKLPPKSNPVTDWHRQAGTRLSLGPRTHGAGQPDKSACPAPIKHGEAKPEPRVKEDSGHTMNGITSRKVP